MWLQYFGQAVSHLWSEQAKPYLADLGLGGPVLQKIFQILWALHHLTGDSTVDCDLLTGNILQDSIVCCRCAPDIMIWLQPVNRYNDVQVGKHRPTGGEGAECTGDDLNVNASIKQKRNHQLEFAVPDKRVASNQRQMQGLETVDNLKNTIYQFLAFEIAKISQGEAAAEMSVIIGITSGTTQRALARNLDGKRRPLPPENLAPGANNFCTLHYYSHFCLWDTAVPWRCYYEPRFSENLVASG